jgi:hypothetical protein
MTAAEQAAIRVSNHQTDDLKLCFSHTDGIPLDPAILKELPRQLSGMIEEKVIPGIKTEYGQAKGLANITVRLTSGCYRTKVFDKVQSLIPSEFLVV